MKKLFVRPWFLSIVAACFVAGLFLASQLFERIYTGKEQAHVDHPGGFVFRNHRRVDGQATFTVEGEVTNTQDVDWRNVELVVGIYAGRAYMTYCRNSLDHIGKRSSRKFRIVCRYTEGHNLPDNINYKLSVRWATKD